MSVAPPRRRDPSDPFDMTIPELHRAYLSGELSPLALVHDLLDRVDAMEPTYNCFIRMTPDLAEEAARSAGRILASEGERALRRLPLLGIPVTVKDNFDLAGFRTTGGARVPPELLPRMGPGGSGPFMPGRAGQGAGTSGGGGAGADAYVAGHDAEAVAALRAAGAVILGKTNLHELAFGATTENPHFGATRNPWDRTRTAGGSSGGAAAALGLGLGVLALGSDTGGSVRCPAALTGLFGLKPAWGAAPGGGLVPLAPSLDCPGVLARTAVDLRLGSEVLLGRSFPISRPADGGAVRAGEGRRPAVVGIVRHPAFWEGLEPGEVRAVLAVADALRARGWEVRDVEGDAVAAAGEAQMVLVRHEAAACLGHLLDGGLPLGPDVAYRLTGARAIPPERVQAAREALAAARAEAARLFETVSVLLFPTVRTTAEPLGTGFPGGRFDADADTAQRLRLLGNTAPVNALGLPAASLPVGLSRAGLPLAAQVVAPDEGEIVRVAQIWEETTDIFLPDVELAAPKT